MTGDPQPQPNPLSVAELMDLLKHPENHGDFAARLSAAVARGIIIINPGKAYYEVVLSDVMRELRDLRVNWIKDDAVRTLMEKDLPSLPMGLKWADTVITSDECGQLARGPDGPWRPMLLGEIIGLDDQMYDTSHADSAHHGWINCPTGYAGTSLARWMGRWRSHGLLAKVMKRAFPGFTEFFTTTPIKL